MVAVRAVALHDSGGYRYVRSSAHHSAGVAAADGFAIRRIRFRVPLPLDDGFAAVRTVLRALDRPLSAFCACELRCPAPQTDQGLAAFNRLYMGLLERWGLMRDGASPIARCDVCPEFAPPGAPAFHAFSFTVPQPRAGAGTFVTSGSLGGQPYLVANEAEPAGPTMLRSKAEEVIRELESRMRALGFFWHHATATQLYTVHDVHPFMAEIIERRGAAPGGLTWHLAHPPLLGSEYQMDVRGIAVETVL